MGIRELRSTTGAGSLVEVEEVMGDVAFQRAGLDRYGFDAAMCSVIEIQDDPMEPPLMGGSNLTACSRRRRRVGYICVMRTDDGAIVMRLSNDVAGRGQLLSGNLSLRLAADSVARHCGGNRRGRLGRTGVRMRRNRCRYD